MLPWRHLAALREIEARLRGSGVRWALTGSASFAPQGVPVEARDIDVQTDAAGAYSLAGRFAEAVTRPVAFSEAGRMRSHFGALRLYGVTVELMGDIAKRLPDGRWEEPVDLGVRMRFVGGAWLAAAGAGVGVRGPGVPHAGAPPDRGAARTLAGRAPHV